MTPIEDFNEITYHFLETIYVHCYHIKGPLHQASKSTNGILASTTPSWNNPAPAIHSGTMDYNMDSSFTPQQNAILNILGSCTSDRGVKIDTMLQSLQSTMSPEQLREALEYLIGEGHVYSTIDEHHYKRTS